MRVYPKVHSFGAVISGTFEVYFTNFRSVFLAYMLPMALGLGLVAATVMVLFPDLVEQIKSGTMQAGSQQPGQAGTNLARPNQAHRQNDGDGAAVFYRWQDQSGAWHMADNVPDGVTDYQKVEAVPEDNIETKKQFEDALAAMRGRPNEEEDALARLEKMLEDANVGEMSASLSRGVESSKAAGMAKMMQTANNMPQVPLPDKMPLPLSLALFACTVLTLVGYVALTHVVSNLCKGEPAALFRSLRKSFGPVLLNLVLTWLVVGIVMGIAMFGFSWVMAMSTARMGGSAALVSMLGFLLVGSVAFSMVLFVNPAIILEGRWLFAALGRSVELGKGFYLRNASILLVISLIVGGVSFGGSLASSALSGVLPAVVAGGLPVLVQTVLMPLLMVATVVLYYDMHRPIELIPMRFSGGNALTDEEAARRQGAADGEGQAGSVPPAGAPATPQTPPQGGSPAPPQAAPPAPPQAAPPAPPQAAPPAPPQAAPPEPQSLDELLEGLPKPERRDGEGPDPGNRSGN